jgi:Ribosomal protein S1
VLDHDFYMTVVFCFKPPLHARLERNRQSLGLDGAWVASAGVDPMLAISAMSCKGIDYPSDVVGVPDECTSMI